MAVPTVAPDDEVKSEDHNALAGLVNGTAGYEQPVKFYRFNNTSAYSLIAGNEDTIYGLAQKWQYGAVGSETEIAKATKLGIIGALRDKGGFTFNLQAFAPDGIGINGSNGASDPTYSNAAWTAAFNAVTAAGGGTIVLGPGSWLAPTGAVTNWPNNCIIMGAGIDATYIVHPNASAVEPINFFGKSNCGVAYLTVDGNRTNNNNPSTGFNSCEVSLDGTRCWAYKIKVKDFNKTGIGVSGAGISVIDCKIGLTTAVSSYTAHPTQDYGGIYGIATGGVSGETDVLIMGNEVYSLRSAGIFVGGTRLRIIGNTVYDCHREYFPAGTGGGQIAVAPTGPGAVVRSTYVVIADNEIGPTSVGGVASGIEINGCDYVAMSNNQIKGYAGSGTRFLTGITLDQGANQVSIMGGSIVGCASGLNVGASGGSPAVWFTMIGVTLVSNTTAINLAGTNVDHFQIAFCRLSANGSNYSAGSIGTDYEFWGNRWDSIPALPNRIVSKVTINQLAADDEILALKSSDVAHGITTLTETDTYAFFQKQSAASGGLLVGGMSASSVGARIRAGATTTDNTRSASANAPVILEGALKSGTSVTYMGADKNLVVFKDNDISRFIFDSDGDSHEDGTGWTAYDDHDDLALLETLDRTLDARFHDPLKQGFADWMQASRTALQEARIVTFNEDGHHFVNRSRLSMLLVGAVRQLGREVEALRADVQARTLPPATTSAELI